MNHWEHFEHVADMGVRGIADSLAGAFEQAALAMTGVITDPDAVTLNEEITIQCEAEDPELLLVDWLNEIIYNMSTRKMLFGQFEVTLENHHLLAKARGENVDISRHHPAVEIKGATYTALKVYQQDNGMWLAQCVVDV